MLENLQCWSYFSINQWILRFYFIKWIDWYLQRLRNSDCCHRDQDFSVYSLESPLFFLIVTWLSRLPCDIIWIREKIPKYKVVKRRSNTGKKHILSIGKLIDWIPLEVKSAELIYISRKIPYFSMIFLTSSI